MKRLLPILVAVSLVTGSLALSGCGGTAESAKPSASQPSGASASSQPPAGGQSGGSSGAGALLSDLWAGIPVYSGASQIQSTNWAAPPSDGDFVKIEWRYYDVNDSAAKIADYYKAQMPAKGWTQQAWTDTPNMSMGVYVKNDEKNTALIYVITEDGKTKLYIMSGAK